MVPLTSNATVGGVPLGRLLSDEKVTAVVNRAKRGGAEIVDLLKTGSAFIAPAAATIEMVDAILLDEKRILPCATLLDGQWGVQNGYAVLPKSLDAGRMRQNLDLGGVVIDAQDLAYIRTMDRGAEIGRAHV